MDYNDLLKEIGLRKAIIEVIKEDEVGRFYPERTDEQLNLYFSCSLTQKIKDIITDKRGFLEEGNNVLLDLLNISVIKAIQQSQKEIQNKIIENIEEQIESYATMGKKQAELILELIENKDNLDLDDLEKKTTKKSNRKINIV